jgi:YidC/Oxa1 family membrane protein insertase
MWDAFVAGIRGSMFLTAQVCSGSLGAGVLVVSLALRLALLPLTLRLAARARAHQAAMAALGPELERLRERYAKDPMKYWRTSAELMRRHGIRPADPAAVMSLLVQAPLLFGLFSAVRTGVGGGVRFLWVRDLAKADIGLTVVVTVLTAMAVVTTPATMPASQAQVLLAVAVIGTAVFLWTTASSVAPSVGAGALVSLIQNWLVSREMKRAA